MSGLPSAGSHADPWDDPQPSNVQRLFLGWDGPALPRAARRIAEEYAGPFGLDLRHVVVVTPAARAGRRLAELLLDQAEGRGVPLTPPRTVTMGRFPELLYQAKGPLADSTLARHAFAHALKGEDPKRLSAVFPNLPGTASGWMALAGLLEKLHGELGREGLDFAQVGRAFREGFPYDDSRRWEVLTRLQEEYLEILERVGFRDRDLERRKAVAEGRLSGPGEIWMVGVVEIPGIVGKMVQALPGGVRAVIHAPDELGDRFDALGCVDPEGWSSAAIPLREETIRVVARPPHQADAVSEILRGFEGRYAAEDVVVGVPDPKLVPYVERGLSMVEVPHRSAGGTPLEETGPVRLLKALAEYLDGRSYAAFGALIRHPDLHEFLEAPGADGPQPPGLEEGWASPEVTGALTDADNYQERHLQASLEGPLPGGDKYAPRMRDLVTRLERLLGLGSFSGVRPLSEWMAPVLEILVRVHGREVLDLGNRRVRQLVDVLTQIKEAAGRLASLPGPLNGEVDSTEALSFLLAELSGPDKKIPPDPEERAVELLGWLELPLDDAPVVILAGVNDGVLPESVGADPFLPGALRSHLRIPDDGARYARDAYLLTALTHSREELHLVSGRLTAGGDAILPSRLLFAAPPPVVAGRIRRFLEGEGRDDRRVGEGKGVLPEPPVSLGVSAFRSPPQDPLYRATPLTRIRVTDFSSYLADPYRYALERVLNLGGLDDELREMTGATFGSLAHTVLERFGRSDEAASGDPQAARKKLERLLEGAVHEEFGRRPLPTVRVQVEQLRARLKRFAEWQAGWVRKGWRVVCVEQQPEPGVPFMVDGEEILLRGKIDRIDHNAETGEWAIFDYKTGDGGEGPEEQHRRGRGKEWVDLQLPLYRRLLAGVFKEDGTPVVPEGEQGGVGLGYILLPKKLDDVGAKLASWTEDELEEAEETARRVVREIRSGEFRYDPRTKSFRDDPFDPLLGRKELPRALDDGEGGGG